MTHQGQIERRSDEVEIVGCRRPLTMSTMRVTGTRKAIATEIPG